MSCLKKFWKIVIVFIKSHTMKSLILTCLKKFWKIFVGIITLITLITSIIAIKEYCDNNKEYSIVYHKNGGIGATESVYTKGSNTVFLPTESMKKDGYTFAGWYDNENYDGNTIKNIPKCSSGNKEFWAKWELVIYTIRFESNGGSNINDTTYTIESENITLCEAKAFKGTFAGWYDNEKYSGNSITDVQKGSMGNKVFWAKWEKKIPPKIPDSILYRSLKDSIEDLKPVNYDTIIRVNVDMDNNVGEAFDGDIRIYIQTIQNRPERRIIGTVSTGSNKPVELKAVDKMNRQQIDNYTIQVTELQQKFAKFKITKQRKRQ
jgi:uncharacterized repeat protein (TIGR02543 family)